MTPHCHRRVRIAGRAELGRGPMAANVGGDRGLVPDKSRLGAGADRQAANGLARQQQTR